MKIRKSLQKLLDLRLKRAYGNALLWGTRLAEAGTSAFSLLSVYQGDLEFVVAEQPR
ncbi:MAG: hypothetical protein ACOX9E_01140 [Lentisphaeria bacterium]|jgi:hypothetical protein